MWKNISKGRDKYMTLTQKQREQQAELHAKLWNMANDLRGNMEAYEFKNYILGVIFYRFLSDKTETFMEKILKNDAMTYEEAWKNEEYREAVISEALESLGYVIEPQFLFSNLLKAVETDHFTIEILHKAINNVEDSTRGTVSNDAFEGLFEDMDLTSSKLGRDVRSRSKLMSKILITVDSINFGHEDATIDILGGAYQYLIGMFAQTAGKKGGEFFTPETMTSLVSRLATVGITDVLSVYDPTCGSAGLLLEVGRHANVRTYFGQELTSTTYNLARMNMVIHNIPYTNFSIKNGDTLENPYFREKKFQIQVANPPYSANWSADPKYLEDDRFSQYGKLAPKGRADFAFVQHMIHNITDDGVAVVLLPHGVLFRGSSEGTIREYIIKELNCLDAVIGLPANCFHGTTIPVACLVFKKDRGINKDNILFIDASKYFEYGPKMNKLREEDIKRILNAFIERKDIEKFAHLAFMDEIKENDYNCNIPRYVSVNDEEEQIDIHKKRREYVSLKKKSTELDDKILNYFNELGV
jgi:type I restriction enzyme M protein